MSISLAISVLGVLLLIQATAGMAEPGRYADLQKQVLKKGKSILTNKSFGIEILNKFVKVKSLESKKGQTCPFLLFHIKPLSVRDWWNLTL